MRQPKRWHATSSAMPLISSTMKAACAVGISSMIFWITKLACGEQTASRTRPCSSGRSSAINLQSVTCSANCNTRQPSPSNAKVCMDPLRRTTADCLASPPALRSATSSAHLAETSQHPFFFILFCTESTLGAQTSELLVRSEADRAARLRLCRLKVLDLGFCPICVGTPPDVSPELSCLWPLRSCFPGSWFGDGHALLHALPSSFCCRTRTIHSSQLTAQAALKISNPIGI
mmetsp:Transcript_44046/g.84578  ORF Transcript_44046/g.84578 Transcript_44046/m.84578 type:complete len:232 (+) Transcript_44046:872-1567(+)